jgi:hypothetical protein
LGGPIGGAWRASYVSPKNGKTLFGFGADDNGLNLRLSCCDTQRILPYIEQCPPRLRSDLLSNRCASCGGGGCGKAVTVTLDGEERVLCCYGIFRIWRWDREAIQSFRWLLGIQAQLYGA